MSFPLLSTMILLPIAAAILTLFLSANAARWTALATTLLILAARNGSLLKTRRSLVALHGRWGLMESR
jgi:NADH:ubiquinone oxidoreductase subunit 4 (subunit M)